MATITLHNIAKSFDSTPVLHGVDLAVNDGEFITLVGPSGCGKSTLLRIIAGLEVQTVGDVMIGGRNVNTVRPADRDIAMVFQNYALYPHLTVRQNMRTPLLLRELNRWQRLPLLGHLMPGRRAKMAEISAIVRDVAETLKIEALLERRPGQLSGGQRQRAALGRAMVRKPVAFLMDEPLSNLDAALRVHMRSELVDLHRTIATTFVYVTHDQAEALTMSDRMAVMMDGEVLQFAPPGTVYDDPQDLRVAEFVGSPKINTLPATSDSNGNVSVLGQPVAVMAPPSATYTAAIRPEHIALSDDGPFALRITHRENLGSDLYLHGATETGGHRMIVRVAPGAASAQLGDLIRVALPPERILLFAPGGERVHANALEARDAA